MPIALLMTITSSLVRSLGEQFIGSTEVLKWFNLALTVFDSAPAPVGITVMVTDAIAPLGSTPRSHVTTATPLQLPSPVRASSNTTPAGSGSETMVEVDVAGPWLDTVML